MLELNDLITQPRFDLDGITDQLRPIVHDVHSTLVSLHKSDTAAFFPTQFEKKEGYEQLKATNGFWLKSLEILSRGKTYNVYLIGCGLSRPDSVCFDSSNSYIIKE